MARKGCFEVIKLKFTFYCSRDESGKAKFVSEAIKKYLNKNASSTSYEISHSVCEVETTDVMVNVEFSKAISVNTVNNFLSTMKGKCINQIQYIPLSKEVIVSVLG